MGIIVSLSKMDMEISYGEMKSLVNANIHWEVEDRSKSEFLFPGKSIQIVVPEGTNLRAEIFYIISPLNSKKVENKTERKYFVAVKNNPYWQLP